MLRLFFQNPHFSLGKITLTQLVNAYFAEDNTFSEEIYHALTSHSQKNWGLISKQSKDPTEEAIQNHCDRVNAEYETSLGLIHITTHFESDITIVLFVSED